VRTPLSRVFPALWLVAATIGPTSAAATTYYVRSDGGSSEQCSGLTDAPFPGSGTGQACAWDHPFRALPPGGPPRISGGDNLIIAAGSYMMGFGAPGADDCSADYPWDCVMAAVPSGLDAAHPTRILGEGWDGGCPRPPQLWGTERAEEIIDLTGTSFAEVACLELTDHAGCVEFHSGAIPCQRDEYPFGAWAVRGLYAEDSSGVRLANLDIHGLASTGIQAGRLSDWTVENVRLAGNGWVGWDGDIGGDNSDSGTMTFRRFTVEWNGCGETYPDGQPTGCWAQSAGGYGDGFGTGETRGDWLFEDSAFLHNTSDGLDLLYARTGSTITIRRTRAEGNAGNQIKTNGPALIENTLAVGNCGFFAGKTFTHGVDDCRAAGNALSLTLRAGDLVQVVNSTVTGEGDCLVLADCDGDCDGSESLRLRNDLFIGHTDYLQPFENTCLMYQETFPHGDAVFDTDYSLIDGVKDDACPGTHAVCGVSPGVLDSSLDAFNGHLITGSPAIDAGIAAGAPADDLDGRARDAHPDLGAYEYRASSQRHIRKRLHSLRGVR
jgi:hypothetical protein